MPRRPIGQILVEKKEISQSDLSAALAEQERSGRRLGEILIEQGRISWLALARAIAEQVLDIQTQPAEPAPAADPGPSKDPAVLVQAATLDQPARPQTHLRLAPVAPSHPLDPDQKANSIEVLLKERQRAFIELLGTTDLLRMKVARLEEIIAERERELAKLRAERTG